MQKSISRVVLAITVVLAGLLAAPFAAAGQEASTPDAEPASTRFGMYPVGNYPNGYFQVEIAPGESLSLSAGVVNAGTEPVQLRSFATNAYNPANGGFAAGEEEDEPTGSTLWLDYEATSFELAPGERVEYPFTVTVPEEAAPGEYMTSLVVRTEESLELPGSDVLRQVIRSALPVSITVPGETTSGFELGEPAFSVENPLRTLEIPVTNTGTVRVRPQGEIRVTTPDGAEVMTSTVEMSSVFGGSETVMRVALPDQMPPGDYLVSVDVTDETSGEQVVLDAVPSTLPERESRSAATPVADEGPVFDVTSVSITPNGDPVQYAEVAATIINNGSGISSANVTLIVQRDGEDVESYPLAQGQSLPAGETVFSQRYIPVDGWQAGTYSFQLMITSVSGGTETVLSTIDVEEEIVVP